MTFSKIPISDKEILSLLVTDHSSGWELLYHKYAPMMYESILNMTGNETIADELFNESFQYLKDEKALSKNQTALCHRLLKHTYRMTLKQLKARKLKPIDPQPFNGNYPLIKLICIESVTLKEAATKSGLAKQDVPRKLRAEFKQLCKQSERKFVMAGISAVNK